MTQVSTLFEGFVTRIETTLPGYSRISNPYELDRNANIQLRKGFGVGFGSATNTEEFLGCQISLERDFFVVLAQQLPVRDNDGDQRAEIEKALMEDQLLLIRDIEQDPTLNGSGRPMTKFIADSGIEFVPGEKAKYFVIEMQFQSTYFENINA